LIDPDTGNAAKSEAKTVKAPPKRKHNYTVEDDINAGEPSGSS
jgi:hypothetical protein